MIKPTYSQASETLILLRRCLMSNIKVTLEKSPEKIDRELSMIILKNTIDSLTILDYYLTGNESHDLKVLAEDVHIFMCSEDETFKFQLSVSGHQGQTYLRLKHRFPYVDWDVESTFSQEIYEEWKTLNRLKTFPSQEMTLRPEDMGLTPSDIRLLNSM